MNPSDFLKDVLQLVDDNSMKLVDIQPLVIKNTEGQDKEIQRKTRAAILHLLRELRKNDEIDFNENVQPSLVVSQQGVFETNSFIIRSTYRRHAKLNEMNRQSETNNIAGTNYGTIIQGSGLLESPITQSVHITPNINESTTNNIGVKWYNKPLFIYFLWPLAAALAAALIGYLIYDYYHPNKPG